MPGNEHQPSNPFRGIPEDKSEQELLARHPQLQRLLAGLASDPEALSAVVNDYFGTVEPKMSAINYILMHAPIKSTMRYEKFRLTLQENAVVLHAICAAQDTILTQQTDMPNIGEAFAAFGKSILRGLRQLHSPKFPRE